MRINILRLNRRSGNKNGRDWNMVEAKCQFMSIDRETGELLPDVGAMLLSNELHETRPGEYDAEVVPFADREGKIQFRISKLNPVRAAGKPPAVSS